MGTPLIDRVTGRVVPLRSPEEHRAAIRARLEWLRDTFEERAQTAPKPRVWLRLAAQVRRMLASMGDAP